MCMCLFVDMPVCLCVDMSMSVFLCVEMCISGCLCGSMCINIHLCMNMCKYVWVCRCVFMLAGRYVSSRYNVAGTYKPSAMNAENVMSSQKHQGLLTSWYISPVLQTSNNFLHNFIHLIFLVFHSIKLFSLYLRDINPKLNALVWKLLTQIPTCISK